MENIEYNIFRSIYKNSYHKIPTSLDDLKLKYKDLSEKDIKGILKKYYLSFNTDDEYNLMLGSVGFKTMRKMVIEKFNNYQMQISPTALKQYKLFGPNGLMNYYLKPLKDKTPDMIYGLALETYILTPELFDGQFAVLDEQNKPNPLKDYRDTENKNWKNNFIESNAGKYILNPDEYNTIKEVASQAYITNNFFLDYKGGESQVTLEGEYKGLQISGIVDLLCDTIIYELKKVQQAVYDRVKWTIQNDYLLQVALYWWLEGETHDVSFICMDMSANVIEVGVSEQRLSKELDDAKSLLNSLIKCIEQEKWEMGVEFINGGRFLIW